MAKAFVLLAGAAAASLLYASAARADDTITTTTTLSADHGGAIVVGADGITLDCAGHRVSGTGPAGIQLTNRTGVTVKNCRVSGFTNGIMLVSSSGNTIARNVATGNAQTCIYLVQQSNRNLVTGNTSSGNGWYGVWLQLDSSRNTVTGNVANNDSFSGFFVIQSSQNTLSRNVARANGGAPVGPLDAGQGFYLFQADRNALVRNVAAANVSDGFQLQGSSRNSLIRNDGSSNQRHGFGLFSGSDRNLLDHDVASNEIGSSASGFYLENSSVNRLSHDVADGSFDGFALIVGVNDNSVIDSFARGNFAYGYDDEGGFDNSFTGDLAAQNTYSGFFAFFSSDLAYTDDTAIANGGVPNVGPLDAGQGFYLYRTDGVRMTDSFATQNISDGFQLRGATNSTIAENRSIANRRIGFGVFADAGGAPATDNTITENTAVANTMLDAQDANAAGANVWLDNHFGTTSLP
jgi:parallel beta-helix repeat protein